jgi:putative ABC transport system permease protein
MGSLLRDLRYGLCILGKNPGFTAVAVITLTLGIGANTAIFSVLNALLLHRVGIPNPHQLVAIRVKYDRLNLKSIVIWPTDFADFRDSKQVFSFAAIMDEAPILSDLLPEAAISVTA